MARTVRSMPWGIWRSPKGHKRALLNQERQIPPASWEDLAPSREVYTPYKAAVRLHGSGTSPQNIIKSILVRFNLTHQQAERIVSFISRREN